jgi:hypothetical protein
MFLEIKNKKKENEKGCPSKIERDPTLLRSMDARAMASRVLRVWANLSCSAPSCFLTYAFAWRTSLSFFRSGQGCCLTPLSTSLCSFRFSKICSSPPPSSIEIAVLRSRLGC